MIHAAAIETVQTVLGWCVRIFRAQGRVYLIGEHTDYNGKFVCPPPSIWQPQTV
jgi:galactokinase